MFSTSLVDLLVVVLLLTFILHLTPAKSGALKNFQESESEILRYTEVQDLNNPHSYTEQKAETM